MCHWEPADLPAEQHAGAPRGACERRDDRACDEDGTDPSVAERADVDCACSGGFKFAWAQPPTCSGRKPFGRLSLAQTAKGATLFPCLKRIYHTWLQRPRSFKPALIRKLARISATHRSEQRPRLKARAEGAEVLRGNPVSQLKAGKIWPSPRRGG